MKLKFNLFGNASSISNQAKQFIWNAGLVVSLVVVPLAGCGGGNSDSESAQANATAVSATPTIIVQPENTTVTELQPASFSVVASGLAPLAYQWRRNGVTIVGATSATLKITSALVADHNAKYSAVVTNSAGSVTSAEAVLTQELPMFLMAGQSNMEGNVDETLFKQLLAELAAPLGTDLQARLKERIRFWHVGIDGRAYPSYGYSNGMATFEAAEMIRLKAVGLVGANLTTPHPTVFCSWNESGIIPLIATVSNPRKRCSNTAGPELVLGQALSQAGYSTTSLIKVAYGGSSLIGDWRSPMMGGTPSNAQLYAKLQARIRSLTLDRTSVNPACENRTCKWSAFIWFQGEADADISDASRSAYKENLKNLIANVRADVGSPNLPVVIVQIGAWAQSLDGNKGDVVAAAQAAVVDEDVSSRIVKTSDLSGFYHYDPAAQLIIGERIALAIQSLLIAAPVKK